MISGSLVYELEQKHSEITIGHLIEMALNLSAVKSRGFTSFNPIHDNLLMLLRMANVIDRGEYEKRWSPHVAKSLQGAYRNIAHYELLEVTSRRPLRTRDLMGHLGVPLHIHSTTRELLGVFVKYREEIEPFLKIRKGSRIVALNADMFHLYGAAILSFKRGELVLSEVFDRGQEIWRPSDMFLIRSKDPS